MPKLGCASGIYLAGLILIKYVQFKTNLSKIKKKTTLISFKIIL